MNAGHNEAFDTNSRLTVLNILVKLSVLRIYTPGSRPLYFVDGVISFLIYDKVQVVDLGFVDLPNVVTDESGSIQICGSTKWKGLRNLAGIFTCILSHESLHLALDQNR
jgi:hypothetical protein